MNIIKLAFKMSAAVQDFFGKARLFYYTVMLFGHRCPKCNSALMMIAEGRCGCTSCKFEFDPTVAFQKCSKCSGVPELRVRRYYCKDCGSEVRSKFLFEGLVFEKEYFAARMAQSRQRKKEQTERVRKMLAESRSDVLPLHTVDFDTVPDLVGALNALTADLDTDLAIEVHDSFDLNRYQDHIQARIGDYPVNLMDIPPLAENSRKDLIWRFIAVIFLDHTGVVDIWQEDQSIMVIKHETDTEGQGVFGEPEETDRIEGPVGRIEA
jgi:Zn finger protein HypA/HybF involved in hydrogenase expression